MQDLRITEISESYEAESSQISVTLGTSPERLSRVIRKIKPTIREGVTKMAEKSRFFNSTTSDERLYDAADMAEVWNTFFTNGVISGLAVSATSSGLSVSAGTAIVNG